jgi:hypothetical protein
MEAFLVRGIGVITQCRLAGACFLPEDLVRPWTPSVAEAALVRDCRKEIAELPTMAGCFRHYCYTHPASWLTPAGQDFARWLRQKQSLPADPTSSDEEVDVTKLGDDEEVAPVPAPVPASPQPPPVDADDDLTCVVCLERRADTLVLPCQHQVCCRSCSDQLKTTPNAHVCVVCRQPITDVLQDNA